MGEEVPMEIHKDTHKEENYISWWEWEDDEVVSKRYSNLKDNTMSKMEYYLSKIEIQ